MNLFTRLIFVSSLSSVVTIFLLNTEVKAFTFSDLKVEAEITSPVQGQDFPNGSSVAGTGIASWSGTISTLDETEAIKVPFFYDFIQANLKPQTGKLEYTFAPKLNLVPVGSGIVNFSDITGPLSPGIYTTSIAVSFQGTPAIDVHKKKVGVWKLSVFRPERKNDSGEFIPP